MFGHILSPSSAELPLQRSLPSMVWVVSGKGRSAHELTFAAQLMGGAQRDRLGAGQRMCLMYS